VLKNDPGLHTHVLFAVLGAAVSSHVMHAILAPEFTDTASSAHREHAESLLVALKNPS
jgi:hypothetical protein